MDQGSWEAVFAGLHLLLTTWLVHSIRHVDQSTGEIRDVVISENGESNDG